MPESSLTRTTAAATRPDEPFIKDAYVLSVRTNKRTPLNPMEYATQAGAMFALGLLSQELPGVPLEIVSQYTGNIYYPVLTDTPDGPQKVKQLSIRIFGSETLHNAALVFCYLLAGSGYKSIVIAEFQAEAGTPAMDTGAARIES